jgi:hypothetical protein
VWGPESVGWVEIAVPAGFTLTTQFLTTPTEAGYDPFDSESNAATVPSLDAVLDVQDAIVGRRDEAARLQLRGDTGDVSRPLVVFDGRTTDTVLFSLPFGAGEDTAEPPAPPRPIEP